MVRYSEIQQSNREFGETSRAAPFVAVFVGGTSGIGKSTIKALVSTNGSLKIYLIGRKSAESGIMPFIEELQTINPNANVAWLEGEVSLLVDTKKICEIIRSKESRIDLLFLSTGYAPFGPREETAEGVEITQSLRYYTRVLFILHLLPLLREGKGRVVSVLAGGMEWAVTNLDDIDLKKPGSFGVVNAHIQCANMTTATMERLADDNPDVTFIHSAPGSVNTGNVRRGIDSPNSVKAWLIWLFLEPLIRLLSFSNEESAQRHLFQSTSAVFGGRGVRWEGNSGRNSRGDNTAGLFLVNEKCDCTTNEKAVSSVRQNAKDKIWDHTLEVLNPYL
jgi:NAD(P)-dependent dehydrogenase (short-subunit alcohol dehydrogenase family)